MGSIQRRAHGREIIALAQPISGIKAAGDVAIALAGLTSMSMRCPAGHQRTMMGKDGY